ncbi:MAG: ECF transporter S component [Oscillospiraceae bacterium]|nr:ECF transporter S component [Oscillospiraceae bacterium]
MACMAMFTALSFVAVLITKWIPPVSGFLSYEPKDALIVIAGFIFGPVSCVIISVLVSLIEMLTISSTGPWGFLMNALASCAFTVPAAWIYSKRRTMKGAVIGLGVGVLVMAACMVVWNYIVTPYYMSMGEVTDVAAKRQIVGGMLASVFLPFNLIKGGINAGLAMLLYKPVVGALRGVGLVAPSQGKKGRFSLGFTVFALVVLVSFVLLLLVMLEKL